jgi:hypothetical protein
MTKSVAMFLQVSRMPWLFGGPDRQLCEDRRNNEWISPAGWIEECNRVLASFLTVCDSSSMSQACEAVNKGRWEEYEKTLEKAFLKRFKDEQADHCVKNGFFGPEPLKSLSSHLFVDSFIDGVMIMQAMRYESVDSHYLKLFEDPEEWVYSIDISPASFDVRRARKDAAFSMFSESSGDLNYQTEWVRWLVDSFGSDIFTRCVQENFCPKFLQTYGFDEEERKTIVRTLYREQNGKMNAVMIEVLQRNANIAPTAPLLDPGRSFEYNFPIICKIKEGQELKIYEVIGSGFHGAVFLAEWITPDRRVEVAVKFDFLISNFLSSPNEINNEIKRAKHATKTLGSFVQGFIMDAEISRFPFYSHEVPSLNPQLNTKWMLPKAKVYRQISSLQRSEISLACEYSQVLGSFDKMYEAGLIHFDLVPSNLIFLREFDWIVEDEKNSIRFFQEPPNKKVAYVMKCSNINVIDVEEIYQLSEIPEYFDDPDHFICEYLDKLRGFYLYEEEFERLSSHPEELEMMYKIERHLLKRFSCF